MAHPAQKQVILFDGFCNLCSGVVKFVIKRDKNDLFRFASLQSKYGEEVLRNNNLSNINFKSFILLQQGKIYTKSTAALKVAKQLPGGWSIFSYFIILPKAIRDAVYEFVAANRYTFFGRKKSCWVPPGEFRMKFF